MAEYRLKITHNVSEQLPYSWEIYRSDEDFPIEKSKQRYRAALSAKIAGHEAMRWIRESGAQPSRPEL